MDKYSKLYDTLTIIRREYDDAVERRGGVARAKERLLNVLFSELDTIMDALDGADQALRNNEMLAQALQDADKELIELRKAAKKKTPPAPAE